MNMDILNCVHPYALILHDWYLEQHLYKSCSMLVKKQKYLLELINNLWYDRRDEMKEWIEN